MVDLGALAAEVLAAARAAPAGRAARSLLPGAGSALTQTMLGLTADRELADHENPGIATLHVLEGRVELLAGDEAVELTAGQWALIPAMRHGLRCLEDGVVLLTVHSARPSP
ncbi:hypothetical protein ER308_01865 [Egibacter rhizosphaerae]|uniref:Cupin type-2 domain-containing protein n=1 Tax=Egibacter rhizosphaerae TaxID=1670831 RepID=A0A411YKW5_9ACTN|nr:hypothetical protein ER308_01865 [Egibacter rhizosphaerae]